MTEERFANRGPSTRETIRLLLYYGFLLIVLFVAFWSFREILSYWFTKTETGGVILSARITEFQDIVRIITHHVLSLAHPDALYYRPTYSLSFSLDYAVWGINPLGYHLTDLFLHMAVAGLLFRVVYLINGRDSLSAGFAGLFYTLHPVLIEVVPAVNHRQESLMATFFLASFWAFFRYQYRDRRYFWLGISLVCFVLAMGAKESGVILLPVIFGHLLIFNPGKIILWRKRIGRSLKGIWPYVLTSALYISWWVYVTNARALLEGGTFSKPLIRGSWLKTLRIIVFSAPPRVFGEFVHGLMSPFIGIYKKTINVVPFLSELWEWYFFTPSGLVFFVSLLGLTGVTISLWVFGSWWTTRQDRLKSTGFLSGIGAAGLLILLVAFPLYSPVMDWAVHQAYDGEGFSWIAAMMDSREIYTASDYAYKARTRLLVVMGVSFAILFIYYCFWRFLPKRMRFRKGLQRVTGPLRPLVFYLWWIVVIMIFFSIVNIASVKHAYHGVLPLGAFLGTLLAGTLRSVNRSLQTKTRPWTAMLSGVLVVVLLIHGGVLLQVSPLLKDYPAWKHAQQVLRLYYSTLFQELEDTPPHSTLELPGVPNFAGQEESFPHLNWMALSMHPKPWLKIKFPNHHFVVDNWTFLWLKRDCPCHIWLEKHQRGSHYFIFDAEAQQHVSR